ncbi:unnamed protein product, partial [Amoebophrya sp. A120]|eukprot:GSA120T00026374001.1
MELADNSKVKKVTRDSEFQDAVIEGIVLWFRSKGVVDMAYTQIAKIQIMGKKSSSSSSAASFLEEDVGAGSSDLDEESHVDILAAIPFRTEPEGAELMEIENDGDATTTSSNSDNLLDHRSKEESGGSSATSSARKTKKRGLGDHTRILRYEDDDVRSMSPTGAEQSGHHADETASSSRRKPAPQAGAPSSAVQLLRKQEQGDHLQARGTRGGGLITRTASTRSFSTKKSISTVVIQFHLQPLNDAQADSLNTAWPSATAGEEVSPLDPSSDS